MYQRSILMAVVLLVAVASNAPAAVGIFEFNTDIGRTYGAGDDPLATGYTLYVGIDRYLITAGGSGIGSDHDHFRYAYNEVSGDVRMSASFTWYDGYLGDWAMAGAMLRETLSHDSVHYSSFTRRGELWDVKDTWGDDHAGFHRRRDTGGDTTATDLWDVKPATLAVQRVTSGGYQIVQSLVDQGDGAGWEVIGTEITDMPDDILAGVAVTAHHKNFAIRAWADEAFYDYAPSLVGVSQIPTESAGEPYSYKPGFSIKTVKAPDGTDLNADTRELVFDRAEWLVENESLDDTAATEKGNRVEQFVNLSDSGESLNFADRQSFPGIDPFEQPVVDLAGGDDDDHFATEVTGFIELSEGLHVIGGSADDGLLIEVGGIEIGRTRIWEDTGVFLLDVAQAGIYPFRALAFEQTGPGNLALYEWLPDGTMLLLNDTAGGGSAVYVPEPASIALLGVAGLPLLRKRRT